MARAVRWLLLSLLVVAGWGCTSVSPPPFFHPGTAQQQRSRAERFDPYPDNTIGPSVDGGRPLDFENPVPEPQRARWIPTNWFRGR